MSTNIKLRWLKIRRSLNSEFAIRMERTEPLKEADLPTCHSYEDRVIGASSLRSISEDKKDRQGKTEIILV